MLSKPNVTASEAGWGSIALVAVTFWSCLSCMASIGWERFDRGLNRLDTKLTQIQATAGSPGVGRKPLLINVVAADIKTNRFRQAAVRSESELIALSQQCPDDAQLSWRPSPRTRA